MWQCDSLPVTYECTISKLSMERRVTVGSLHYWLSGVASGCDIAFSPRIFLMNVKTGQSR
jgi:hypothetical protein